MGLCTKRRIHVLFLVITIMQIITTGLRQVSDFFGPLWALILTNFFNIVFCIFGFFGGYTRRKYFLVMYIVWSILWTGWNVFIFCLYIPSLQLDMYKSSVLSIGTGGFSWWETRAPGCIPDWASETHLIVTNCSFDPNILEGLQAGLQIYLAVCGIGTAISLMACPYYGDGQDEKDDGRSMKSNSDSYKQTRTVPAFLSLSRSNGGRHSLNRHGRNTNSRLSHRGALNTPKSSSGGNVNANYKNSKEDPINSILDERLRPMTPRKVKRRSARSIQSQRYGPTTTNNSNGSNAIHGQSSGSGERNEGGNGSKSHSSGNGGSNRNSLRSNHSSRRSTNNSRNSKRKPNNSQLHFVSPVNRLMQQQIDSETSHDEPRYHHHHHREQGIANPVYVGQQSPGTNHHRPPPRPPSARSSYSNYHPARLPINSPNMNPNVFNLNQTLFTNPAFDSSTEYNNSILSNNTNMGYYEDELQFHSGMGQFHQNNIPPVPIPRPTATNTVTHNNLILHSSPPPPLAKNFTDLMFQQQKNSRRNENLLPNAALVYPLAHSPVSQESFPMWGIAQAQVPTQSPGIVSSSSGYPPLMHSNRPYSNPPVRQQQQQPNNSETVI